MASMERLIFVGRLDISFSSQYVLLYSVYVSAASHSDALEREGRIPNKQILKP